MFFAIFWIFFGRQPSRRKGYWINLGLSREMSFEHEVVKLQSFSADHTRLAAWFQTLSASTVVSQSLRQIKGGILLDTVIQQGWLGR